MSNNCQPSPNDPCGNCQTACKDFYLTECIIYSGASSTCLSDLDVVTNTNLNLVIETLMAKLCELEERILALEP